MQKKKILYKTIKVIPKEKSGNSSQLLTDNPKREVHFIHSFIQSTP